MSLQPAPLTEVAFLAESAATALSHAINDTQYADSVAFATLLQRLFRGNMTRLLLKVAAKTRAAADATNTALAQERTICAPYSAQIHGSKREMNGGVFVCAEGEDNSSFISTNGPSEIVGYNWYRYKTNVMKTGKFSSFVIQIGKYSSRGNSSNRNIFLFCYKNRIEFFSDPYVLAFTL